MNQVDFITELKKLPLSERLQIIETLLVEIRQELRLFTPSSLVARKRQMMATAVALKEEYLTNAGLTVFTALDAEDFQR
jgi:hypothetical protein